MIDFLCWICCCYLFWFGLDCGLLACDACLLVLVWFGFDLDSNGCLVVCLLYFNDLSYA